MKKLDNPEQLACVRNYIHRMLNFSGFVGGCNRRAQPG
jgi:hypothetical protein